MNDRISQHYGAFYRKRNPIHVYPVEFVVRAFLGNYPRHQTNPAEYIGKKALSTSALATDVTCHWVAA